MSSDPLREAILRVTEALEASREELCRLDGFAGDGDHGLTMAIAARTVRKRLAGAPDARGTALLDAVASGTASVGGASGPIYAAAISAVASELRRQPPDAMPTTGDLRRCAQAAYEAVRSLGAAPGDKTMLDAFLPAVDALRAAEADGVEPPAAGAKAARAAREGAASTATMVAKVGRASRLGERSRGSADAGATSFAIIVAALADSMLTEPAQAFPR